MSHSHMAAGVTLSLQAVAVLGVFVSMLLWILVAIFLIYLIRATRAFSRIMEKFENDVNHIGDTTKELLNDLKESVIFKFLFGKKKKSRKD